MSESTGPAGPALENRLPAEGINSSPEHPLKEFGWIVAASVVTLLVVVTLVGWGARWLAPMLPYSEKRNAKRPPSAKLVSSVPFSFRAMTQPDGTNASNASQQENSRRWRPAS